MDGEKSGKKVPLRKKKKSYMLYIGALPFIFSKKLLAHTPAPG
jgi:hypothetical protein